LAADSKELRRANMAGVAELYMINGDGIFPDEGQVER